MSYEAEFRLQKPAMKKTLTLTEFNLPDEKREAFKTAQKTLRGKEDALHAALQEWYSISQQIYDYDIPSKQLKNLVWHPEYLYRVRTGDGEFIKYHAETWVTYGDPSEDLVGKFRLTLSNIGVMDKPQFAPVWDEGQRKWVVDTENMTGVEKFYQIPCTKENLEKYLELSTPATKYAIIDDSTGVSYGTFSRLEIEGLTFDELISIGKYGRSDFERQNTSDEAVEKRRKRAEKQAEDTAKRLAGKTLADNKATRSHTEI